jgi:hypothetical protein
MIPYVGGKSRIADWIISLFPEHSCYIEAFGGGGWILHTKEPSGVEVYNDIDKDLINLFQVLRDPEKSKELYRRFKWTLHSRADFLDQREMWRLKTYKDEIEHAFCFAYYMCAGRHPANLLHDGSDEVLEYFPEGKGQVVQKSYKEKSPKFDGIYNNGRTYTNEDRDVQPAKDELGSAARFYYCAKPSRAEKDAGLEMLESVPVCISNGAKSGLDDPDYQPNSIGMNRVKYVKNFHTTIKPIELMRYLCRLVTPPKGVVLDPYLGSGTTAIGAVMEYFNYIGIEQHPGYCAIAAHRIEHWMPSFLERYFANEAV